MTITQNIYWLKNNKIKIALATLILFILFIPHATSAAPLTNKVSLTLPSSFASGFSNDSCQKVTFIGLEPWYHFLPAGEIDDGTYHHKCDVRCFNIVDTNPPNSCGQIKSDVPYVLIAVIDDLLRIAGLVAVGFVLFGAFKYVGSQGSPEGTAQAQSTVINALIGLAITSIAVVLVNFLGNSLGG